jgi:hypothetical protein
MIWERLMRMLRIHQVPMPDDQPNPELEQAKDEVEQLHRKAERVLDEYGEAEQQRLKNGRR